MNLHMKENESIVDFSSRPSNVINQLKSNGEYYQEQRIVEKIFRSLPHKYDNLVMTIEEAKDLTILTMDELMGTLQTHEHRINRSTSSSSQEQEFKLNQIQEEGGEEEMAQVKTLKAEVMKIMDRGMLLQKTQEE